MKSLHSNGPARDFVHRPYQKQIEASNTVAVASPYVTLTEELRSAASSGKDVRLIVGLNVATSPAALRAIIGIPNLLVRYYTHRFHAKVYLFDNCALVGSSNLTDGGMKSNREATILIEQDEDLQEVRSLFQELWSGAPVLTPAVLTKFEATIKLFGPLLNHDAKIEDAVGRAEPQNISVKSLKKTSEYLFLESLRTRVYEQFKPAFDEVTETLGELDLRRRDLNSDDTGSETNRFLNWVRLAYGAGDEWQKSPKLPKDERLAKLQELGREWVTTDSPRIPDDYAVNMTHLRKVFENKQSISDSSREELTKALMSVHAFGEQHRFVKGGIATIFWKENNNDVEKVKRSLSHLVFGQEEFITRLYEILHLPEWKLRLFGQSCALELTGTIRPEVCPPANGRTAKGLLYIGFSVPES